MSLFRNPQVQEEYERWKSKLPQYGYDDGLSYQDVLEVHFVLADMFYGRAAGLGGIGPRSLDLLVSAVSRQHVGYGGQVKWSRIEELAATLLYGIVLNHPFHDANKRTAFLSTLLLLKKNRMTISVSETKFEDFTVSVADRSYHTMQEYKDEYADQEDADVKYISKYIRLYTRQSDKKDYIVTYRELNAILRRFGFELRDPHDNTIDVVQVETSNRVCNIGFHGMTKQVSKRVIKYVRDETGLAFLNGCDSGAFFKGEEPLNNLLAKYYEPLERLAFR